MFLFYKLLSLQLMVFVLRHKDWVYSPHTMFSGEKVFTLGIIIFNLDVWSQRICLNVQCDLV